MRINKLLVALALTFPILFAPNVMASGEINFAFTCKVLDQQLLGITDGKSSRYSGYADGTEVGDTFKLDFIYEWSGENYYLEVTSGHKVHKNINFVVFDSEFDSIGSNGIVLWKESSGASQLVSDNMININGQGSSQITGRRYYKNDWNLMLRFGSWDQIFIQTANCMNVPHKLGIMMEKIRAFHK